MGQDLLTYFPDAEINVVDSISTGGDIQIYIGTDSTNVRREATVPQIQKMRQLPILHWMMNLILPILQIPQMWGTMMTRQLLADMTLVLTLSSKE